MIQELKLDPVNVCPMSNVSQTIGRTDPISWLHVCQGVGRYVFSMRRPPHANIILIDQKSRIRFFAPHTSVVGVDDLIDSNKI